jgi:hypothetical protein
LKSPSITGFNSIFLTDPEGVDDLDDGAVLLESDDELHELAAKPALGR